MTEDIEALRREFDRVSYFQSFDSSQRIWWIYMRNAAIEFASRRYHPDLQTACDQLKAFPEGLPGEGALWLALRHEVGKALEAHSRR